MDILVIAPTPYFSDRGCHIRIYEEASALQHAGHTPVIFTYHLGRDLGTIPVYRISPVRWYAKTAAGPAWGKLYLDWKLFWLIVHQRKQYSFKVIHAHLHEGAWVGWLVKHLLHIPLVLDAQGSLTGELQAHGFFTWPGVKQLFQLVERCIIRISDAIVVSSRGLYEFMHEQYPRSHGKTELLADAVRIEQFLSADTESVTTLRATLGITDSDFVIMYTGGLSRIKGIHYLLEAMPRVISSIPRAKLVIIGYGDDEQWKSRVNELGIAAHVVFVGQVAYDQLANYLQIADLAIDPKPPEAHESSGKLLNYMAAGLPVIAFESSSTRAMLNETGALVSEISTEALAGAIIELAQNNPLREQLGKSAQARIHEHFNWNQRISTLTALYARLTT